LDAVVWATIEAVAPGTPTSKVPPLLTKVVLQTGITIAMTSPVTEKMFEVELAPAESPISCAVPPANVRVFFTLNGRKPCKALPCPSRSIIS